MEPMLKENTENAEMSSCLNNVDVNSQNIHGDTVLHRLAAEGDVEQLRAKIQAGAHVNIQNKDGQTPLFRAAKMGHEKCVQLLIDSGADVHHTGKEGNTALFKAAEAGHEQCVQILVDSGTLVNKKNKFGRTALFRACARGSIECLSCINILIKAGADVNMLTRTHHYLMMSCLTRSVQAGNLKITQALLDAGAETNIEYPPLITAVVMGKINMVSLLIEGGANVNLPYLHLRVTALMEAVQTANMDIVRLLLDAGADVNKYTSRGMDTALLMAGIRKDQECMDLLLKAGAHVNLATEAGYTPLMFSVKRKCRILPGINVLKTLLQLGAHVNVKNNSGQNATALYVRKVDHRATWEGESLGLLTAAGDIMAEEDHEKLKTRKYLLDGEEDVKEYFFPSDPVPLLMHLCREAIKSALIKIDPHMNLFLRVPKIGLPIKLTRYLLYNMSLDWEQDIRSHHWAKILHSY